MNIISQNTIPSLKLGQSCTLARSHFQIDFRMHESTQHQPRVVCPKYHCRASGCCVVCTRHGCVNWWDEVGRSVCRWSCLPNFSHLVPLPSFPFLRTLDWSGVSRECEKTTLFTMNWREEDGCCWVGGRHFPVSVTAHIVPKKCASPSEE